MLGVINPSLLFYKTPEYNKFFYDDYIPNLINSKFTIKIIYGYIKGLEEQ